MLEKYKGKTYCFSPPVMLATLIAEFSMAAYATWRYKMDTVKRLAVTILMALGVFQLAEYMVCGGLGISGVDWARTGYVAITLLPALGIHMITAIANQKAGKVVKVAYATCAIFVGYYVVIQGALNGHTCYSNYAVFHTSSASNDLFLYYYYGWLLIGLYLAYRYGKLKPKYRPALNAMIYGYTAFIAPTTFFNIVNPTTVSGIPSIMCGFAVIFAIVLVAKVLPSRGKINNELDLSSLTKKIGL
ncbi:hypothetical protein HGB24_03420, partial [Candidatus Saccharibacteria bacterium]|nr:hypothetical protein [Candidatus Saccharibacteria bacterium]